MKNLLLFFTLIASLLSLASSCEKDNSLTNEFIGEYHGQDVENRVLTVGGNFNPTYKASVNVKKNSETELDLIITLCHDDDGKIQFELTGVVDDEDSFTIVDEPLLNKVVDGHTIEIKNGKGRFVTTLKNLEITFKEIRTFNNNDPDDDGEEYESTHTIKTNRVGTGGPGC